MNKIVAVRLREVGKTETFLVPAGLELSPDDFCIVEQDRGLEYGVVVSEPSLAMETDLRQPLLRVVRKATAGDLHQIERNKKKVDDLMKICQKKIKEHNLQMKLVDAEYSFDRSKILFYFTADGRVDFRNLVRDLAAEFKARIELKQIGVRDEAKLLGGFGPCGRPLCCAKFLKDFRPVTIKMAKEQNLPLSPTKISGFCGRLMCCLAYEYETYKMLTEGLPRLGDRIKTKYGVGKVVGVNAIKRKVTVELDDGQQVEI